MCIRDSNRAERTCQGTEPRGCDIVFAPVEFRRADIAVEAGFKLAPDDGKKLGLRGNHPASQENSARRRSQDKIVQHLCDRMTDKVPDRIILCDQPGAHA